jgi:YaiO family outer membrane protein
MKTHILALMVLWTLLPWPSMAQNKPDQLLKSSLEQIQNKDFVQALKLAHQAIALDPTRSDLLVFMANLQAWQHQTDSAVVYLQKAYRFDPGSQELYDAWLNTLLWGKDFEGLLSTVELALRNGYINKYNLLIKRVEAFQGLEKNDKALALLNDPENAIFLDSSKVSALRQELFLLNQRRNISVSYNADWSDAPVNELQQLAGIDFSERFHHTLAFVRFNYAHRFGKDGLQIESDVYQNFANKSYLYLNAGLGMNSAVFPTFRAGAEYTFPFMKTYEGSVGARYLQFPNRPVVLLTGQLAKYLHSWWIGVRPFYTLKSNGNALTTLLDVRKYEHKPRNFSEVELGYGNSPDERLLLENGGQYFGLDAWKIKLSSNRLFRKTDEIKVSASYSREERTVGAYRNRIVLECLYQFRLP